MINGSLIEAQVNTYLNKLNRGEVRLPPALVEEFLTGMRTRFMEDETEKKFTLRMSTLGKPLCQIQHEVKGSPRSETFEQFMSVRFATGDMLELWLIMVLQAAGVEVQGIDIPTSTKVAGQKIDGTADIIIDGAVYDIKTASAYSFKKYDGFASVWDDDPFGYCVQGFLYSDGLGIPFGGWIVVNKSNGEIKVVELPEDQEKYKETALTKARNAVTVATVPTEFVRDFEDEEEKFRKKPTGNRKLKFACSWCPFKEACWKGLVHHPKAFSKAKDRKWEWYTELKYVDEGEEYKP